MPECREIAMKNDLPYARVVEAARALGYKIRRGRGKTWNGTDDDARKIVERVKKNQAEREGQPA